MQRRFFNVGRHGRVPSRNTILFWVKNFRTGATALKKTPPGDVQTIRTPRNIQAVQNSPTRSTAKHAIALGISDRSVRRILHLDLKFHPYKMMVAQELSHRDWESRRKYARNIDIVLICVVTHFHLSGCVNKENFWYWSNQNPHQLHERPLHSDRVTVWCSISKFDVIGPYIFEENSKF
ncbi:hypothetical protein C0J52_05854 [Blattella germanica]|nr:hypothetical protein C0J52_05854 [Blattella germanica]